MESAAQLLGNAVVQADKAATLWINSFHAPWSDSIWMFFSDKWVWVPLYALILVFLFLRLGWKKALLALLTLVLTIVCCDQLANVFKDWVCRPRPSHDAWMLESGLHLPGDAGGMYGFFSAHAANAFGFAIGSLCLFREDQRHSYNAYGAAILIWAFLVSLSRIFMGRHYLGDVIFGALVGLLLGWLLALLCRRLCARL